MGLNELQSQYFLFKFYTEKIFLLYIKKLPEQIMAENFSNVGKGSVTQIHEAQSAPGRTNPRMNTPRDNSHQTDKN